MKNYLREHCVVADRRNLLSPWDQWLPCPQQGLCLSGSLFSLYHLFLEVFQSLWKVKNNTVSLIPINGWLQLTAFSLSGDETSCFLRSLSRWVHLSSSLFSSAYYSIIDYCTEYIQQSLKFTANQSLFTLDFDITSLLVLLLERLLNVFVCVHMNVWWILLVLCCTLTFWSCSVCISFSCWLILAFSYK